MKINEFEGIDMIKLKNVSKYYYSKGVVATGFSKVNLEFSIGEFVAITGESGSGKTTLLNVISGLDTYEEGEMYINGEETSHYIAKDFEEYRRKNIGNIYQNFNLVGSYTVYQNIAFVLMLNGEKNIKPKVLDLIKKVDLYKYRNTKVSKLSGGQKQRVAIARALAKDVPIIIADEPTGNLDKRSALSVMRLLSELSKDRLVIVVTHNYEQVEPYVTRKITMHDGRVLEDVKIKKVEKEEKITTVNFKNMSLFNRIRIGVRNTFNIVPKFLLLLIVFFFVVGSLMSEYSFFKKDEELEKRSGYNYIFQDTDIHRIVSKKVDKTSFTEEELEKIKALDNMDYIIENDLLLDSTRSLRDSKYEYWINANILPTYSLKGNLDYGRMPENEYEAIIEVDEDDYYFSYDKDSSMEKEYYFVENSSDEIMDSDAKIKIVGIKYSKASYYHPSRLYVSDTIMNRIKNQVHQEYSTLQVKFMNKRYPSNSYDNNYQIVPREEVPAGEAFISENLNYMCPKENCLWNNIEVFTNNLYYTDQKTFIISRTYNKNNINKVLNIDDYKKENFEYQYEGKIFINRAEYNSLFDKGTFQISIYVKDVDKIDDTKKQLQDMGLTTLAIKDTLVQSGEAEIIRILKTIVTIILVITLFFISYFIIKIILKSRNTYYSIVRMLGGSKAITRQLLMIELITVANITYFIYLALIYLNHYGYMNVEVLTNIYEYFTLRDYIILYAIITGMAFLSSMRYSRKLFKDSVMSAYREEV